MNKIIALLVAGSLLLTTLVGCGPRETEADKKLKEAQAQLITAEAQLAAANAALVSAQAETERILLQKRMDELVMQIAKLRQEIEFLKSQGAAVVMTAQGQKVWYESQAFLYLAAALCLCLLGWLLFSRAAREWAITRAVWENPQIAIAAWPQLAQHNLGQLPSADPALNGTTVRRLSFWNIPANVLYLLDNRQFPEAVQAALRCANNGKERAHVHCALRAYAGTLSAEKELEEAWAKALEVNRAA